jgi:hypothetical protein
MVLADLSDLSDRVMNGLCARNPAGNSDQP